MIAVSTHVRDFCLQPRDAIQAVRRGEPSFDYRLVREVNLPGQPALEINKAVRCDHSPEEGDTRQADFDLVFKAVVGFSVGDKRLRTNSFSLYFTSECERAHYGPRRISYWFVNDEGRDAEYFYYYVTENIAIDLRAGTLKWYRSLVQANWQRFPRSVTPVEAKVPAERALASAEQWGGVEFRGSVKDQCEVKGSLESEFDSTKWEVRYYTTESTSPRRLQLEFDAVTGQRR